MKNILIVGGGNSGSRYCCSMLFFSNYNIILSSNTRNGKTSMLAKQNNVPFYLLDDLKKNINDFDLIVLSTPISAKKDVFEKLVVEYEYRNKFILEKPLAITEDDFLKITDISKKYNISFIVGYQRRYCWNTKIEEFDVLEVLYPSIKGDKYVIHNLAHAVDLCMHLTNEEDYFEVKDKVRSDESFILTGICGGKKIRIIIYQTDDTSQKVIINGTSMPWVTLEVYNNMIDFSLKNEKYDFYKRDRAITKVLSECKKIYEDVFNEEK